MGPLRGPGSEGAKGSEGSEGSEGDGLPLCGNASKICVLREGS